MRKSIALLAVLLALLPGVLTAQTAKKAAPAKAQATLSFVDDETEIVLTDPKGNQITPQEGIAIPLGTLVETKKTTAEIKLEPNGSILKLAFNTKFKVNTLKEADGTGTNDFSLQVGKIRAVAAKLTGTNNAPGYTISTPTANCGVRGTDFAMMYDEATQKDWVCVQEGLVDFTNIVTGAVAKVATGQFANTFDAVFEAATVDASKLEELFSDLTFTKLNPLEVPSREVTPVTQEATPAQTAAAEEKAAVGPVAGNDIVYEFLKKFFGLEVGSITINGQTYSKAVLSPTVAFDSFKLGLYLPIVYTADMFNPHDWYRPNGNDEWSFGTDKKDLGGKIADAAGDIALKIKYLEWGNQQFDPFYLKVGNLKTMSLGHGTVVSNFANDQDFPAIRKIGLNTGAKFGPVSFEGLTDDLANASIIGGRFALDLIGDQVALGFQATTDLHLATAKDLSGKTSLPLNERDPAYYGDPMLIVGGVDLQLFKLDGGAVFRTKAFADFNTLAPYFRADSGFADQGLSTATIWHDGPGSFGGEAGLVGNIAFVNYRLSYQLERGLYTNAIFQGNYYRTRSGLLSSLVSYLGDPTAQDKNLTMGVFGSADFDLFGLLTFEGAYRWPFELKDDGSIGPSDSDYLKLAFTIPKDKIPFVALSGGVSYERTKFLPSIRDGLSLFDGNTVLKGEVIYGLAQGLDLVVGVGTATVRNSDGSAQYDTNGNPKVAPMISLDTRLSL